MIEITQQPIDLNVLVPMVNHPDCGAMVMFVGATRQHTGEIETAYLEYEAYDQLALHKMKELESLARARWPLRSVVMVHRLGKVEVMEPSVAVLVASPHRKEAFEAAKWLIDELKHQVPIWKREHYVQRGAEWIHPTNGSCSCDHHAGDSILAESVSVDQNDVDQQEVARQETVQQQQVAQQ